VQSRRTSEIAADGVTASCISAPESIERFEWQNRQRERERERERESAAYDGSGWAQGRVMRRESEMRKRERRTPCRCTDSELDLDPAQRERMIVDYRGKEKGGGEKARPRKLLSISSSRDRLHFLPRLLPRGARLFSFLPPFLPFQSVRDMPRIRIQNWPCLIARSSLSTRSCDRRERARPSSRSPKSSHRLFQARLLLKISMT